MQRNKPSCGESRLRPSCLVATFISGERESRSGDVYIRNGTVAGYWPNEVSLFYAPAMASGFYVEKEFPDEV